MDIKDIKRLLDLIKQNDLSEFELVDEEFRLSVKRKSAHQDPIVVQAAPQQIMMPSAMPHVAPAAPVSPLETAAAAEPVGECINSPMVGTFYRSSSPETDAFVSVGQAVEADTVVCIVEAMKVMNEIKAERSGMIKKILVDDASPVEYDQPLFEIDPA